MSDLTTWTPPEVSLFRWAPLVLERDDCSLEDRAAGLAPWDVIGHHNRGVDKGLRRRLIHVGLGDVPEVMVVGNARRCRLRSVN